MSQRGANPLLVAVVAALCAGLVLDAAARRML